MFEKPDGFRFTAGQHVRMSLIDPPETDREGNSRFFSLASTPQDPELMVAMRMRDTAFKRVLGRLQRGGKVLIEMLLDVPRGAFALHEDPSRPAVFIAGGIGVVPAFSMIKDAIEQKLPHRVYLFYANRRPEDAAYLEELATLARQNPSFTLVATMTEAETSARRWTGEAGRIDRSMLARHIDDPLLPIYYISGLPKMASAMKVMLGTVGVGKESIKAEEFTGFDLNKISAVRSGRRFMPVAATVLAVTALVALHAGVGALLFGKSFAGTFGLKSGWSAAI
ncbi:MAG: FAD-dependent oxidoreductase [Hyphomicrobiales bacterium]|nr:MAG: FAD-dependent oxidoreductase [Hyphomicrobiales bacterium]